MTNINKNLPARLESSEYDEARYIEELVYLFKELKASVYDWLKDVGRF